MPAKVVVQDHTEPEIVRPHTDGPGGSEYGISTTSGLGLGGDYAITREEYYRARGN